MAFGKPHSLERLLVTIILLALLVPSAVVGWLGYSSTFAAIRAEKIRSVGRVAEARRDQLVTILTRTNARAGAFLADLGPRCGVGQRARPCIEEALRSFVSSERALGATLRWPGVAEDLSFGGEAMRLEQAPALQPGQLAWFPDVPPGGARTYHIVASGPQAMGRMVVSFPGSLLQDLFGGSPDLGQSGETFLADHNGYFITHARYPSVQGSSHPISARPMQACLAGNDREVLDADYRDVAVIHGFRQVREIGGGCIMAHFDQDEAFAPLRLLQWQLAGATLAFALAASFAARAIARSIIGPIAALTQATREIIAGDYDARAEVVGNNEISELARSFNRMSERLQITLWELREHKGRLEERVLQRTTELEAANRKLEALSRSDGLTGLGNRRHLDEVMDSEWRRAARLGLPVSLVLLDVDHFKLYNDRYGHQAGDVCLRRVAEVLGGHAQRAGELAARYGGEEFAVFLPGVTAVEAGEMADSIRRAVAAQGLPHADTPAGVVTVSLGVATLQPDGGEPVSVLIAAADKALYRAKSAGRNRVAFAAENG